MTSIHYHPGAHRRGGGWLAAVRENTALALLVEIPGTTPQTLRPDALWNSLGSPDGIQATLEELTRHGLSATPSFALVSWEEGPEPGPLTAVIRGAVTLVTQTGETTSTTDARDVSTWREQKYTAVSLCEMRVGVAAGEDDEAAAPETLLLLHSGTAWASRVIVDRVATEEPAPVATAKPEDAPASTDSKGAPAQRVVAPVEWVDPEATVNDAIAPRDAVASSVPAGPPGTDTGGSSYDYLFGETMFRSVEDAAVREDAAPTEAEEPEAGSASDASTAGDHDGHTIANVDIAKLRAGRKARGVVRPPAPAPGPHLYLETPGGSREELIQPVVVGRSPSASKVSGGQIPRLVTVGGSDQDISRNHAKFAIEGGTVVVTDLHSRNGTTVILPGRQPQQLRQGEPTSVIAGTVIDLGGGVTFTVREG